MDSLPGILKPMQVGSKKA
uniref:Uncharacterized protein n=1 Tax=Arundo donax TaxID=35708 RepID=A0A0A8Y5G7_ARUDO